MAKAKCFRNCWWCHRNGHKAASTEETPAVLRSLSMLGHGVPSGRARAEGKGTAHYNSRSPLRAAPSPRRREDGGGPTRPELQFP